MIHLHGIPNCDSVSKTRKWLEANGVAYSFHNFREKAPTKSVLKKWCKAIGWQKLLNKQSTAWRALSDIEKNTATALEAVVELLYQNNNLIKRPVVTDAEGKALFVGYNEAMLQAIPHK